MSIMRGPGGRETEQLEFLAGGGSLPRWVAAVALVTIALNAVGAVLALIHPASLLGASDPLNSGTHVYARYLVSRDFGLALMLSFALARRAVCPLATLVLLAAVIQFGDAVLDAGSGRVVLVPGLAALAVAQFLAAGRISRGRGRPYAGPRPSRSGAGSSPPS